LRGGLLAWARTLLIVMIGWVFFRSVNIEQAFHVLSTMFGLSSATVSHDLSSVPVPRNALIMLVGLVFALFPFERTSMRLEGTEATIGVKAVLAGVIFIYAVALLQVNSFNPFIYFRF
jgi:alginate O-acetyltransferase complex protein AlgI